MGVVMPRNSRTSYFTKRGKHFGNLWAVYSCKAKEVLLLSTDRQLAHWLLFLEFSPSIKCFSFKAGSLDFAQHPDIVLNYHAEVFPVEGENELHYLQVEGRSKDFEEKVLVAKRYKYKYMEFNDEDWMPKRHHILPLLKVASFLAGSRNLYIPDKLQEKSINYVKSLRTGTLRGFLSALSSFDGNLILVVFARLFLQRVISVSYQVSFFSQDTEWVLNEN